MLRRERRLAASVGRVLRDFDRTIISEFSSSPTLCALITSINEWIDPDANFEAFYTNIWNIDSASGFGLDIWGRIVGINRIVTLAGPIPPYFGWEEARPSTTGFNQAPFYSGPAVTQNFTLTDEAYRNAILVKAAQNITNCSIPAINQILLNLFPGRGSCYVLDGLNMTLTYVFNFALVPFEVALVTTSGVLPKPTGVKALYIYPGS